jgi:hypothetical protein
MYDWHGGSTTTMHSAAWYYDADANVAWVLISEGDDACSEATAVSSGSATEPAAILQFVEWSGASDTYSIVEPGDVVPEDGETDVTMTATVPGESFGISFTSGSITVVSASVGGPLDVIDLSGTPGFGDSVSGSFEACWCDAVEGLGL